ncbi:hypothetical protein FBU30_004024 [Linnemannia zychae]|nr:hypothetical protein FBU30_004024 [Linnemannia zychae]
MLRPIKSFTTVLVGCLFFTFILISTTSISQHNYTPRHPSTIRAASYVENRAPCKSSTPTSVSSPSPSSVSSLKVDRPASLPINDPFEKKQGRSGTIKIPRQVKPFVKTSVSHSQREEEPSSSPSLIQRNRGDAVHSSRSRSSSSQDQERYLMYVPYAGVTNQLISIWHGSLIARALNRTLLIPNLSPNVHVEPSSSGDQATKEPAPTKWSEFFDLDEYARKTGLRIEELDSFLERRGIIEQSSLPTDMDAAIEQARVDIRMKKRSLNSEKQSKREDHVAETRNHHAATTIENNDEKRDAGAEIGMLRKRTVHKKRWIQFESLVQQSHPTISKPSGSEYDASSQEPESNQPFTAPRTQSSSTRKKTTLVRQVRFPTVQKCFSEAGYGTDRRIDMTGRRFMQRYNIDPNLIPTPFLDPRRDNGSIWSRWRMDKVIERYQQPEYVQEEILCLGHVYRLLPGGHNRIWTEFGQYFRYTKRVETFIDEILNELLPKDDRIPEQTPNNTDNDSTLSGTPLPQDRNVIHPQFVGLHLRRGDFYRHCLGIASPADPNGWNRCYPSTDHIISLLDSTPFTSHSTTLSTLASTSSSPTTTATTSNKKLPVLVLTNEHDPKELAKADAQNWIRVDHARLGTLEKFGRYGPILIDGALLARASLLVGVEYSTYFRTASKRAETWYHGQTLFVV